MGQNIAKCGNCGETNFCGWYRKDAPKDRYGRIDRDYMDSDPVAYCSEECRDTADAAEPTKDVEHWEHADFADFKRGDRIRFVTNDYGLGEVWRTGTVTKVTDRTIEVGCDRNSLGVYAVIRLADWSHRCPMRTVADEAPGSVDGTRFCGTCGDVFATTAELDAHQDTTGHEKNTPAPEEERMQVWTLMKGEMHEGGTVIGIYADRDLARGQFITEARNLAFGIDDARQDDDGAIRLEAGCDWLSLEPHELITQDALTA